MKSLLLGEVTSSWARVRPVLFSQTRSLCLPGFLPALVCPPATRAALYLFPGQLVGAGGRAWLPHFSAPQLFPAQPSAALPGPRATGSPLALAEASCPTVPLQLMAQVTARGVELPPRPSSLTSASFGLLVLLTKGKYKPDTKKS